ncbi:flagellar filament capping protein FliD [Desulfovibrio subterraneus]|uniref:Flagellar hook-associated protein 2 n=1 Tax=Desulfovibrio subterraneus TaxID=2718620 RepID=A0A7J0BPJ8_9BACT|nr:flagellar filament capping protein FliD [Desulfovibrio subterraneus]WBF66071.1 flagellar filament capping protein FliD [Desulfovibrio subterraneus]GFM35075.1 flagellar hook-associated protein 2 [Desulfovibrio subterraneus]
MTEYWSGSITFTGLGSGTDFDSIIEATVNLESHRLNRMEAWSEQWTEKQALIQGINTKLLEYKTALSDLNTMGKFLTKSATSTDSSTIGVTAGADAIESTHTIVVNQLAQNDLWSGTHGWSSSSDVITTTGGTFALNYAGKDYSIDVPAGTTLQTFVNLINADAALNDGVRASLVNDGSEYHLQLRGMDLGADNAITITGSGITGLSSTDFTQTQKAQNAQMKVDGYPSEADKWIERDSNVVSDVVEGLTFTLYDETDSKGEKITVVTDSDSIIKNIENFITLTNEIRTAIAELDETSSDEEYDDEKTSFYQVRGNYGMDIVEQNLQSILADVGLGFKRFDASSNEGDPYSSLAQIGISTETDQNSIDFGMLILDYDELQKALDKDPDAVARLFSAQSDGVSYSGKLAYESSIADLTSPGLYDVQYQVSGGVLTGATINGNAAKIDPDTWTITGISGNPEQGLIVNVSDRTDGSHQGDVAIRQGKVNETLKELDRLTDTESGTLNIIIQNYQTIIDNTAKDIGDEEDRIERLQQRLVEQYARLEASLGNYENINSSLESLLAQLE